MSNEKTVDLTLVDGTKLQNPLKNWEPLYDQRFQETAARGHSVSL